MPKVYIFTLLLVFRLFSAIGQSRESDIITNRNRVFITPHRIAQIKKNIASRREPTHTAYLAFCDSLKKASKQKAHAPQVWYVPGFYTDSAGHVRAKSALSLDANQCYTLALGYQLHNKKKYARKAIKRINAWVYTLDSLKQRDDSKLAFSYHFPAMIFAADLLRNCPLWKAKDQAAFEQFLTERALPMHTMERENNWGNWGVVLVMAIGAYQNDEGLLLDAAERWRTLLNTQLAADGHLVHEVNRSGGRRGLWYTHFSLMPQTIAAEIGQLKGIDLYGFHTLDGKNLRIAYEKAAYWTANPSAFSYWQGKPEAMLGYQYISYFELLNNRWRDPNAVTLLRNLRPLTPTHATPFLTLTHGQNLDD